MSGEYWKWFHRLDKNKMMHDQNATCRKPFLPCLLIIVLLSFSCLGIPPAIADGRIVTVGVYENAPKIFTDESGKPAGIFIDIIEDIAQKEGWALRYQSGAWGEGLDRLEKGEIAGAGHIGPCPGRSAAGRAGINSYKLFPVRHHIPLGLILKAAAASVGAMDKKDDRRLVYSGRYVPDATVRGSAHGKTFRYVLGESGSCQ